MQVDPLALDAEDIEFLGRQFYKKQHGRGIRTVKSDGTHYCIQWEDLKESVREEFRAQVRDVFAALKKERRRRKERLQQNTKRWARQDAERAAKVA